MESKHMLMSAFGVGIGVGLGLGLASGSQNVSRLRGGDTGITPLMMEHEILGLVVNGRDISVSFDQFPYYISVSALLLVILVYLGQACCLCKNQKIKGEQTRVWLTSAAFVHLQKADLSYHTWNLSPASRAILHSDPAETYQQMLSKALAHYFEAKLL